VLGNDAPDSGLWYELTGFQGKDDVHAAITSGKLRPSLRIRGMAPMHTAKSSAGLAPLSGERLCARGSADDGGSRAIWVRKSQLMRSSPIKTVPQPDSAGNTNGPARVRARGDFRCQGAGVQTSRPCI
jgi:hypothetical protein